LAQTGVPLNQLSVPCMKDDMVTIQIFEEDYVVGLEEGKHHLHDCIVLNKCGKPLTHLEFFQNL